MTKTKMDNDLISRRRIRYELGESTMPKRYREFCLRVIDSERLTPTAKIAMPMKVIKKFYTEKHIGGRKFYIAKCPNCNSRLEHNSLNNYCGNCGQRLDWEEQDE